MPTPKFDREPRSAAPVIVTATMGAADFAWAEGLRRRFYPADRNQVPAHLTLFHHLPPSALPEIRALLSDMARGGRPPARIEGVYSLDRGVALAVHSPALLDIRTQLAKRLTGLLLPQDQAPPRLHITIQNKVVPAQARATLAELRRTIVPRALDVDALACWSYRGGPWTLIARHAFRG